MSLISDAIKKVEHGKRTVLPGATLPGTISRSNRSKVTKYLLILAVVSIAFAGGTGLYIQKKRAPRASSSLAAPETTSVNQRIPLTGAGKDPGRGTHHDIASLSKTIVDVPKTKKNVSPALHDHSKSNKGSERVFTGTSLKSLDASLAKEEKRKKISIISSHSTRSREKELEHFNEGVRYFNGNDYLAARREFERSLEYNPENVEVLCNLGATSLHLGDFSGSRYYLKEALRISPGHTRSMVNLGALEFRLKHYLRAAESFSQARSLSGESPSLLVNLGLSYYRMGEKVTGTGYLKRATERFPDFKEGWYNLGIVYLNEGELIQAKKVFKVFLLLSQKNDGKSRKVRQVLESIQAK